MPASHTKSFASFKYRIVASLALLTMLAACGYKGPLYMPPPAPQESLTTPPQASEPASGQGNAAPQRASEAEPVPVE